MRIHIDIDFQLSRRQRTLVMVLPALLAIGSVGIVNAAPEEFVADETLTAAKLNGNFDDLQASVDALDTRVDTVETSTASHSTQIDALETQVDAVETESASHNTQIAALDGRTDALEALPAPLTTTISVGVPPGATYRSDCIEPHPSPRTVSLCSLRADLSL